MKIENKFWLLIVITSLQTIALIYLISQFNQINNGFQQITSSNISQNTPNDHSTHKSNNNLSNEQKVNISLLKEIFKQELAGYFQENPILLNKTSQDKPIKKYVKHPELLEKFNQQIDQFIADGQISNISMENLYAEMSVLSPQEIKSMLSKIAIATNNGQLKLSR